MKIEDKWRLGHHLMPPDGWLNDPNGLCWFKGEYHVFFQHTAGVPEGGLKSWGHYTSPDLIHWTYVGDALTPTEKFESHGVYSGSALIKDGTMHLFYTGNVKLQGDHDYVQSGRQGNTIMVSSQGGYRFGEKQWVLKNEDYPEDISCHVRDPKVMAGSEIGIDDGAYYMFLGARSRQDVGEVLMYRSEDLETWQLKSRITTKEPFGYMWECPDAFMIDGKKFLSISPQGVEQQGLDYQNIYQSGYFSVTGDFDKELQLGQFFEWDKGFDFYAPQSFLDPNGRRILIGWIGMPDAWEHKNPTVEYGWQHTLTIPREITCRDNRLFQYPVEEITALRMEQRELPCGQDSESMKSMDVKIEVDYTEDFLMEIQEGLVLKYTRDDRVFSLTFDEEKDLGYGRRARSAYLDQLEEVRVLIDTSCVEIYLNHGMMVFTTRFYPENGTSQICVKQGAKKIEYWEMKSLIVDENLFFAN